MRIVKKEHIVKSELELPENGQMFIDEWDDVMLVADMDGQKVVVSFEENGVFVYDDADDFVVVQLLDPENAKIQ